MGAGDGLGGCHACIKYLMFAFNFIFWLIGCALVGVGIWVMVDDSFKELMGSTEFAYLQYGGITLIVIGGIIMVVGFFGCCGAIRESQCLLVMFFISMMLIFMVLTAAGVVCLIQAEPVIEKAIEAFEDQLATYKENERNELVDLVQQVFKCCGGKLGVLDYTAQGMLTPPPTCYPANSDGIPVPFLEGCPSAVPAKLKEHTTIAAGVCLGAAGVILIGMIFSMMLCCAIRDQE
ncbi:CD9 antigen-like [Watersipora subatra]|uniref:CD9 antigen-like n=1 Tax=Watersipora subatra TaxID=2589382 RepID=UPI00355BD5F1